MAGWTLITGASSGIGWALAERFAIDGHRLIISGSDSARLDEAAARLHQSYGIEVRALVEDLSVPGAGTRLAAMAAREGLQVDCLVNNAGFGIFGAFPYGDKVAERNMLQVNMIALVELTRAFLEPMQARGLGRILNVASTAAFQPGPYFALYYASKSFVLSFSLALRQELRNSGVTVTVLCPGSTRTGFNLRAGVKDSILLRLTSMEAGPVAAAGYRGLMRDKAKVIPGFGNKISALAAKLLPVSLIAWGLARVQKP